MNNLLNQSAAHKLAKSLEIRLGTSGIKALNTRIGEIVKEASVKARKARRKTILDRDVVHEKDLFIHVNEKSSIVHEKSSMTGSFESL